MALDASGPISLGGSTTGQSVNLELGQSATAQISFNDASVRVLTNTTTGSSVAMPTDFWGQTYFAPASAYLYTSTFSSGDPDSQFIPSGQVTDSSGNTYIAGTYYGAPSPNSFAAIVKINRFGVIQWQKYISGFAFETYGFSQGTGTAQVKIGLDSSNNLYMGFYCTGSVGATDRGPGVIKLDSNGTVLWCRQLAPTVVSPPYDYGLTCGALVGTSGTVFTAGVGQVSGTTTAWIATLDTSGNFLSKSNIDLFYISGFVLDSSDNIYLHGYTNQSLYGYTYSVATVIKLNSSLTIQWQKYYTVTATGYPNENCMMPSGTALAVADSGDLYLGGAVNYYRGSGPPYYYGYVGAVRISSSTGSVLSATAQRVSSNYNNCTVRKVVTDSSNNVYLITASNNIDHDANSNTVSVLFKYPSGLGSVTYQYRFQGLGDGGVYGYYGSIPSSVSVIGNSLFLSGIGSITSTPTRGATFYQLPNNGSYFGANRYFYPPATTTGYLAPDNPGFSTDSTFASAASTSALSTESLSWGSLSPSVSSVTISLMTPLTTTY